MGFITGLKSSAGDGKFFGNKLAPVTSCGIDSQGKVTYFNPNFTNIWFPSTDFTHGQWYVDGPFTQKYLCMASSPTRLVAELPFYDSELNAVKAYLQCWWGCRQDSSSWYQDSISILWSSTSGQYTALGISHPSDLNNETQYFYRGDNPNARRYFSLVYDESLGQEGYCGIIYGQCNIDGVAGGVPNMWDIQNIDSNYNRVYDIKYLADHYGLYVKEVTESEEFGEPSKEGGYTGGTFDDSSDIISLPTAPTLGVTSTGFINVYAPSQGELIQFGSELFPDLSFTPVSQSGTPSSVTDALVAMAQVLVDLGNQIPQMIDMYINSNLINYVIDCHVIPVSPVKGGASHVKVGFKTFTPMPVVVTSDYVDFDCGTLNVGEYYANFIDYLPYTRAKLYLPFVGFIDLAPEYWQSGSLNVTYRFNIIDGSFVAFVKSTSSKSKLSDSVIGQFGGNACIHIPITGLNYASMVSGIVGAMSPLLPSATGGVGDAMVNSANAIANNKPNLQQSNGYNATTSFLTVRYPYLLIERSVSNFSRKYAEEDGIPSNITLDFSSLSGLTKATMLHLDGISGATEDDLDEIASLLSEGVIL